MGGGLVFVPAGRGLYINNNYYYVGLLAGIWPCGIITIVDELYKTESKSQVYGCLHGFIHSNPLTTQDISKCIIHHDKHQYTYI